MAITLRVAAQDDIDVLLGFMQEYYAFDHLQFDERVARAALETFVGDESLGRVWLIVNGEDAIGYIVLTFGYSLEYGGRDAFIDEFYLGRDYRGRGIGSRVLSLVEAGCPSLGIRALHLEVERANTSAQGLYRKVGFVDHDRYLMSKRLSA